jgi:hypothetical protein
MIDINKLKITMKTKAIILVHLYVIKIDYSDELKDI